ncbi:MAG: glycosyltransferase family 2 protein [Bacteroidota bacterium]
MSGTDSLVSIIIPTHNRLDLLPRAIQSALSQSYPHIEVMVVNDGSSDQTPAYLEELAATETRVRWISHEVAQGVMRARNHGIEKASGEYVCFLDDDDELDPDYVQRLKSTLDQGLASSFAIADYCEIRTTGRRISQRGGPIELEKLLWVPITYVGFLCKRAYLLEQAGFDPLMQYIEDYELTIRLIKNYGPAYRVSAPLYIYHLEHRAPTIQKDKRHRTAYLGHLALYNRHKADMSKAQRRYHVYRMMQSRGSRFSLCRFLKWVPRKYWAAEINTYLLERTSLYKLLNSIQSIIPGTRN